MDKYEYKVRADEIRDLIAQRKYVQAAEIADTIDWSRVKKSAILCTISDLYKKIRKFDEAIELLQLAYERYPGGKDICYSLCELYIKTNNIIKAVATYKEFLQVASTDSRRYILQYKIYEMQDISLEERIEVLEELKSRDYREKWAYTLAYLYHRVGLATKCVDECDELILWFDEGKYVYMAMELKMRHQPLTPAQQEKYDHRFDVIGYGETGGQDYSQGQAGYYAGGQDYASEQGYVSEQNNILEQGYAPEQNYAPEQGYEPEQGDTPETVYGQGADSETEKAALAGQTVIYNPVTGKNSDVTMVPDGSTVVVNGAKGGVTNAEAIALSMGYTQVYHGMQPEPEIQVKQVDVGEYNTINLQQALAEDLARVLENNGEQGASVENIIKADTKEIFPADSASAGHNKNSKSDNVEYAPQSVTDKTVVIAKVTGSFDATKTIPLHDVQKAIGTIEEGNAESGSNEGTAVYTGNTVPLYSNTDIIHSIKMPQNTLGPSKVVYPENNQEYVEGITPELAMSPAVAEAMSAQPPEQLAEVMTQEPDGQLSLVMPEDKLKLVSQITGQLSINDVMAEWNRMKYEHEELNRKKYHELVKQQTGELFNEFEKAALNGVLETLERESADAARAREEAERLAEEERVAAATNGPVQKLSFDKVDMSNADESVDDEVSVEDEIAVEEEASTSEEISSVDEITVEEMAGLSVADTSIVEEALAGTVVAGVTTAGVVAAGAETIAAEVATAGAETIAAEIATAGAETIAAEIATAGAETIAVATTVEETEDIVSEVSEAEAIVAVSEEKEAVETITDVEENDVVETVADVEEVEAAETVADAEENDVVETTDDTSFEENIGEIFNKIEEESEEGTEDFSAIWSKEKAVTEESNEAELVEEIYENSETVDEFSEEETTEETDDMASEEVSENSAEDDDPRNKTYSVYGMNETTNHYINLKLKKEAEKLAAAEAEASEEEKEKETDDTRELTPEEEELFGPYIHSKESKKQIINVIDNVSMASYTGNIIITGGDGSDVSDLATVIMKEIKQTDSNFSGKVARVPADKLNSKKMEVVAKQLANGALIIENASMMSDNTAANLYKCLDQENLGLIITMLDTERNMEKLLSRVPRLSPLFTARMNVKPMTKEQLSDYAVKYAYEREFSIDHMGMLALARKIEDKQTASHSVNVVEVREIIDQAIDHVSKKTIGHFFDILGGKRYDSEDMIILGEKDFK